MTGVALERKSQVRGSVVGEKTNHCVQYVAIATVKTVTWLIIHTYTNSWNNVVQWTSYIRNYITLKMIAGASKL